MIIRALQELGYGKCKWHVKNHEIYDNLFWLDTEVEKPTKEILENKINELLTAEPMRLLRLERNRRLAETDWITLKAYSQKQDVSENWANYMQELRDLPATAEPQLDENGMLTNVTWPKVPE